ncbi:MAG: MarC family protein, partial [Candidatus Micrarchaeota archaeon]|nr:MarC family protein [Candidatus Micrarchaeota archaeon]
MAFNLSLILQLFVLLNPLSSFPVLLAAYKRKMDVPSIAVAASVVAFIIALSVIFFGPFLFSLYGISIDSFRVAGGVVLFLLGIDTIRPKHEEPELGEVDSLISIIATPLLTGPATISYLTLAAYDSGPWVLLPDVTLAFLAVGLVFFLFSLTIKRLNPKVVEITAKVL